VSWSGYTTAVARIRTTDGVIQVGPAQEPGNPINFLASPDTTIHIITAHNPLGRFQTAQLNNEAQERLEEAVSGLHLLHWPAAGADPEWVHVEQSLAIIGLDDAQACRLGADFKQDAIFAWTANSWRVLQCDGNRSSVSGWHVTKLDDPQGAVDPLSPPPDQSSNPDLGADQPLTQESE
jgi:hypothetical protein